MSQNLTYPFTGYTNELTVLNTNPDASNAFGVMNANGYYANGTQAINGSGQLVGGAVPHTDYQQFVGIADSDVLQTAGTYTVTRIAAGNYALVKTAAADTSIICISIDSIIRTATGAGFKLTSIDVVYSVGTLALTSLTPNLYLVNYVNNTAVNVAAAAVTGTLAVATQTNPYVTNLAVTTPAYDNTTDSRYSFELTCVAQASSTYSFYGLMLKFTRNDV